MKNKEAQEILIARILAIQDKIIVEIILLLLTTEIKEIHSKRKIIKKRVILLKLKNSSRKRTHFLIK